MADIKELTIKRGRIKTAFTNFEKFLLTIDRDSEITSQMRINLKMKLDRMLPKYDEFVSVHYELCLKQDKEDDSELEAFEIVYYHLTSLATDILNEADKAEAASKKQDFDSASQCSDGASASQHSCSANVNTRVQLPSITLPKFSGKPESWLDFRDMFQSLIHTDTSLDDTKKLYYLRGALDGDAKLVLQGLKTTAENYETAWACLCERYENRRLLVQNHLNSIYGVKPIKQECPKMLRELLDKLNFHLRALENLQQPVNQWDTIIIFLLCKKLDSTSIREWESIQIKNQIKTLDEFKTFIRSRADMLESLNLKSDNKPKIDKVFSVSNLPSSKYKCNFCRESHLIYYCEKFKELDVEERIKRVAELKLCANCLGSGHLTNECKKNGCIKCKFKLKHNSLLHRGRPASNNTPVQVSNDSNVDVNLSCHINASKAKTRVLLPTAIVDVVASSGKIQQCRLFLDQGSQVNLISAPAVKRLGLSVYKHATAIGGIGTCVTKVIGTCGITIRSRTSEFRLDLQCSILDKISNDLPQFNLNSDMISIPNSITLADPNFAITDYIDILIGAGEYYNIVKGEIIRLGKDLPVLLNTELGWVISGKVPIYSPETEIAQCFQVQDIQDTLTKFWEIEDIPQSKHLTIQEEIAETHFIKSVHRDNSGRFVTSIPFKEELSVLGQSEEGAKRRFLALERKLQCNSTTKNNYVKFMQEYLTLGHMELLSERCKDTLYYFLPHHCVFNIHSPTTKTRVVFDGSFTTSSGLSRNQIECVGPVVQSDLISILLRFRCYPIAITADIEKMYRQVLVTEADQNLQCIFWRSDPAEPLNIYKLKTLTYGTASASFLATRCLLEIAKTLENSDPDLALIIKEDFYVDDVLTGVQTILEGEILCAKLKKIMLEFCFPLQKWNTNKPSVLKNIEVSNSPGQVRLSPNASTKTLGLLWEPRSDTFHYSILSSVATDITKRSILSSISQIFDPLGLVGPCVILPKIMLQNLWELDLGWDTPVPEHIASKWSHFRNELIILNSLKIPRCITPSTSNELQLHGFADASERAYGACIYMRCQYKNEFRTFLVCAKSKVAPLKLVTIPRLELCAALVLSKLLSKVLSSFRINIKNVFLWSDSEIVLCWLKRSPSSLKLFVANRVAKIQALTQNFVWSHVGSQDNPADLISRGLMPSQIIDSKLWWKGPAWLSQNVCEWPTNHTFNISDLPEIKVKTDHAFFCNGTECLIDMSRFSQYRRLLNACAYMLRFINRLKKTENSYESVVISPQELKSARDCLIKWVQSSFFHNELNDLSNKGSVKPSSILAPLCPFMDEKGILRVSGRLQNSNLSMETKHPIILPPSHIFTKLLFNYEHCRLGHAGPQQLLNSVRQTFWPLHGKALARKTLYSCVRCYHVRPKNTSPRMAPLPAERVTPAPPFFTTGVDYAGPLMIKEKMGRSVRSIKCYIALFICFATKAIHIELVSSLSTPAFIAAFRRFCSRRGKPATVWSDNGTNFVGANNELGRIVKELSSNASVSETFSIENINWRFIPSNSPHFGGLWESGVRGIKFHLKRIVGNQILSFEELNTLCCQVEAIVNSRPLTVLSDDSSEPSPLTPAHFLIGRSLTALPDESLAEVQVNRLSRFQLIQQMTQAFWARWSNEYLNTLQARNKWMKDAKPPSIGQLVLVRCDQSPPLNWPLGRIQQLHPGKDGVIRVASIKLKSNCIRRAIIKLYPLPIDTSN